MFIAQRTREDFVIDEDRKLFFNSVAFSGSILTKFPIDDVLNSLSPLQLLQKVCVPKQFKNGTEKINN